MVEFKLPAERNVVKKPEIVSYRKPCVCAKSLHFDVRKMQARVLALPVWGVGAMQIASSAIVQPIPNDRYLPSQRPELFSFLLTEHRCWLPRPSDTWSLILGFLVHAPRKGGGLSDPSRIRDEFGVLQWQVGCAAHAGRARLGTVEHEEVLTFRKKGNSYLRQTSNGAQRIRLASGAKDETD